MKLKYPAIFYPWDEGGGYTVEVPDLPGCVTEGDDLDGAILMGVDAASGWVLTELQEGRPAPTASELGAICPEAGGFVRRLSLDIAAYAESASRQSSEVKPSLKLAAPRPAAN